MALFEIYKEVEFHRFQQQELIVSAGWAPFRSGNQTDRENPVKGYTIRNGSITVTVNVFNRTVSNIYMSFDGDFIRRYEGNCKPNSIKGSGCTITFTGVDVCHAAKGGLRIKATATATDSIDFYVPWKVSYIVTKVDVFSKLMQRGGKEMIHQDVLRSSVCA